MLFRSPTFNPTVSTESFDFTPVAFSLTANPDFSYKASNETGPNSVSNLIAPYTPPDTSNPFFATFFVSLLLISGYRLCGGICEVVVP